MKYKKLGNMHIHKSEGLD